VIDDYGDCGLNCGIEVDLWVMAEKEGRGNN
jgi:hypothetical protein